MVLMKNMGQNTDFVTDRERPLAHNPNKQTTIIEALTGHPEYRRYQLSCRVQASQAVGQPHWEGGGGDKEVPVQETESSVDDGKCSLDPEWTPFHVSAEIDGDQDFES